MISLLFLLFLTSCRETNSLNLISNFRLEEPLKANVSIPQFDDLEIFLVGIDGIVYIGEKIDENIVFSLKEEGRYMVVLSNFDYLCEEAYLNITANQSFCLNISNKVMISKKINLKSLNRKFIPNYINRMVTLPSFTKIFPFAYCCNTHNIQNYNLFKRALELDIEGRDLEKTLFNGLIRSLLTNETADIFDAFDSNDRKVGEAKKSINRGFNKLRKAIDQSLNN